MTRSPNKSQRAKDRKVVSQFFSQFHLILVINSWLRGTNYPIFEQRGPEQKQWLQLKPWQPLYLSQKATDVFDVPCLALQSGSLNLHIHRQMSSFWSSSRSCQEGVALCFAMYHINWLNIRYSMRKYNFSSQHTSEQWRKQQNHDESRTFKCLVEL